MQSTLPITNFDKVLTSVRTVRELDTAREQSERYLRSLYKQEKGTLKTLLSYSFSEELGMIILEMLQEQNIDERYKMKQQEFFVSLSAYLQTLPVLTLTVAFLPTKKMLIDLSDWARKNLDIRTILSYETDETLIAGAVIEYKGIYKELSLRTMIPQQIEKHRDALLGLLV